MNILETITLYWNEFGIIYNTVLGYGTSKIFTVLLPMLLTFGILRSAYHYAKGNKIRSFFDSMFSIRLGDKLLTLVGLQDETRFRKQIGWTEDRNKRIYEPIPVGSSLIGVVFDTGIFVMASLLLFLIWPIVAFISITVGPLHICRVHNIRKKRFIANLKGEEANA